MSDLDIMLFIRELDKGTFAGWEFAYFQSEGRCMWVRHDGSTVTYPVDSMNSFRLTLLAFEQGQKAAAHA